MDKTTVLPRSSSVVVAVEQLEGRQLLSGEPWAASARAIGEDLAAKNYPKLTGAGETVVIIDSGVDYKHPALGGGIGAGKKVVWGWDYMKNDGDPMPDTFAHGTGVAGVLAADPYVYKGTYNRGVAPGVKIIAVRQDNSNECKAALEWALANRAKYNIVAINLMDYGGRGGAVYQDVVKKLIGAGVFFSQPAGNAGAKVAVRPALDPSDFQIGSASMSGQISSFSQRGRELDLLALGEKVTLPYYDVGTKKHIYVDAGSGTSWSSPAVVGTAALIKQIDARFTPAQIMRIMQDSGASVYDSVSKLTYKRLNVNAALALAYQRRPGGTPQAPLPQGPTPVPAKQSPFSGKAITIAATGETTIQAEDFDNGGEGVAFHDTDSANVGGNNYRPGTGVDVESSAGGGRDVGFIRAGEWLEYTVNVATAGTFNLTARVASLGNGGKFHVEVDGVDKTGAVAVADTHGWQKWATVGKGGVSLAAGTHVIRVKADSVGAAGYLGNVDWIKVSRSARSAFSSIAGPSFSAQSGLHVTRDYLDYVAQGGWAAYAGIDFGSGGATKFTANVSAAAGVSGGKIQVRLGSPTGTVVGTLTVGTTGSWSTFKPQSTGIARVTGVQNVYLTFVGSGWIGNVRSFQFA